MASTKFIQNKYLIVAFTNRFLKQFIRKKLNSKTPFYSTFCNYWRSFGRKTPHVKKDFHYFVAFIEN